MEFIGNVSFRNDTLYYIDALDSVSLSEQVIYLKTSKENNPTIIHSVSEWLDGCSVSLVQSSNETSGIYELRFDCHPISSDYKHLDFLKFSTNNGVESIGICTAHGGCKKCQKESGK